MTEKKTAVITINDKDYTEEQLTDEQKAIINHIRDLDRKVASAQFNLDQLVVGRQAFVELLNRSLTDQVDE